MNIILSHKLQKSCMTPWSATIIIYKNKKQQKLNRADKFSN